MMPQCNMNLDGYVEPVDCRFLGESAQSSVCPCLPPSKIWMRETGKEFPGRFLILSILSFTTGDGRFGPTGRWWPHSL